MIRFLSAAAVAAFAFIAPASAASLLPGSAVNPTGADFTDPVHGGVQTVLNDILLNFALDPPPAIPVNNVNGVIQNRVSALPSGFLSFGPRIRNTVNIEGGIFAIESLALTGFGSFTTDVEFRTDSDGDIGLASASRSVDGNVITLRYGPQLLIDSLAEGVQQESLFPSIVTNATHYSLTGSARIVGYLIDEDVFDSTGTIVPGGDELSVTIDGLAVPTMAPVPLPASSLLLLGGLAVFAALRRSLSA